MRRVFSAPRRYLHGLSTDSRAGLFGLGWSYLTHGLQLVVRFGSSLILTRLLVPADMGIFGTALGIIILFEMLSDIGVRPAVVRSANGEDPKFLGTVWTILLIRSIPFSLALIGLAYTLPGWYGIPELENVWLVLAVRPIIIALQNPTIFVLYRRLDYKTPFYLDMVQTLITVPVTIFFAWQLQSVWGLVYGLLFGDCLRLLLSHFFCPKAPRPCWHRPALRELLNFGIAIFLNTLVYGAWIYFDRLAGPKFLPVDQIGLFMQAWTLAEAMDILIGRGSEVFYSMLSRVPEGDARGELFRRTARRIGLYLLPGMAVAAVIAPWAFTLLYPFKFHGAGVLLGLLTARLIMRGTGHLQFMYLMMRGEVHLATRAYLISLLFAALGFVFWVQALEPGVLGMAMSSVLAMTNFTLAQTWFMWRRGEASAIPTVLGLFWTAIAVAAVLLLHAS